MLERLNINFNVCVRVCVCVCPAISEFILLTFNFAGIPSRATSLSSQPPSYRLRSTIPSRTLLTTYFQTLRISASLESCRSVIISGPPPFVSFLWCWPLRRLCPTFSFTDAVTHIPFLTCHISTLSVQ